MVLEGRVQVTVGKEHLVYEAGPFTCFGTGFLLHDFVGGALELLQQYNNIPPRFFNIEFTTDNFLNLKLSLVPLRAIVAGESALSSPTELDPSERPSITSEMTDLKRRATFIPDYCVKVLTDVYFLRVRHDHYRHALAATELERVYNNDPDKANGNTEWQDEIEKV